MNTNIKQKEYWSGPAGKVWVEGKAEKDNMLLPLGNAALDKSNINDGMKVLEVGCGTGYVMAQLSSQVGEHGKVFGVDISQTMIGEAEIYLKHLGIMNTNCKVLDAENDPLDESFYDSIFSRFGVMFFSKPIKAFDNINKSLKKNAYITFICWQEQKLNPWNGVPLNIVKKYIELPILEERAPSPFAFANKDYIYDILINANFKNIDINSHSEYIELYKGLNLQNAVREYLHKTPIFTKQFLAMSDKNKSKLFEDLQLKLKKYYHKKVLKFPSKTWIIRAQK